MLKKAITYTNFEGEEETEVFYFNLTKAELIRMEVSGGNDSYETRLMNIIKSNDRKEIVAEFEKFILTSYGIRSDDGKRFIKSEQLREEFKQTAAYDELLISFFTDPDAGSNFINGIMPKQLIAEVNAELAKGKSPSDIARERSEANMQGHLTKAPAQVTATVNEDAQNNDAAESAKNEERARLQAQLDALND